MLSIKREKMVGIDFCYEAFDFVGWLLLGVLGCSFFKYIGHLVFC
jgi:hypothetical protein